MAALSLLAPPTTPLRERKKPKLQVPRDTRVSNFLPAAFWYLTVGLLPAWIEFYNLSYEGAEGI